MTSDKLSPELLPCPFCGGDAAIEQAGTTRKSMIVGCLNCGARTESGDVMGFTRPANFHWNQRSSSPTQQAQRIEELEKALRLASFDIDAAIIVAEDAFGAQAHGLRQTKHAYPVDTYRYKG